MPNGDPLPQICGAVDQPGLPWRSSSSSWAAAAAFWLELHEHQHEHFRFDPFLSKEEISGGSSACPSGAYIDNRNVFIK